MSKPLLPSPHIAGVVAELWRYPVKSMQGEPLRAADVGARGLLGDRAYAVIDLATGHVASAKHPGKWARLFACQASYATPPVPGAPLPPVTISLPDGAQLSSADPECDTALSHALGRPVALRAEAPPDATREADRAPIDAGAPAIRSEPLALAAPGTFFDYAPVHLLTNATLARLRALYPSGAWQPRRFRPNIVLATDESQGYVELEWLGRVLAGADGLRLHLIDPAPRCVIPTLAQAGLPRDPGILRTLAAHTRAASVTLAPGAEFTAVVGVYAQVRQAGALRLSDTLALYQWAAGSSV